MNILYMLPSEIERLRNTAPSPEVAKKLLDAIRRLLATPSSQDEGIFLAASVLSKIGLERFLSPAEVATAVEHPDFPSTRDFISGLDDDFAARVRLAIQ